MATATKSTATLTYWTTGAAYVTSPRSTNNQGWLKFWSNGGVFSGPQTVRPSPFNPITIAP